MRGLVVSHSILSPTRRRVRHAIRVAAVSLALTPLVLSQQGGELLPLTFNQEGQLAFQLEGRPYGQFYMTTRYPAEEVGQGPYVAPKLSEHPGYRWEVAAFSQSTIPGGVRMNWQNCRVRRHELAAEPYVGGDFDVILDLTSSASNQAEVHIYVDSRLDAGIHSFRWVQRITPGSFPPSGSEEPQTYAFHPTATAWVANPIQNMTFDAQTKFTGVGYHAENSNVVQDWCVVHPDCVNPTHPPEPNVFSEYVEEFFTPPPSAPTTGFHASRLNLLQLMSVHTPDWGIAFHGLDTEAVLPGRMLMGSNYGSLEFGYEGFLPADHQGGNTGSFGGGGIRELGAGFRFHLLPAARPLKTAWWEAAAPYREFLDLESQLRAGPPLALRTTPPEWARVGVYAQVPFNDLTPATSVVDMLESFRLTYSTDVPFVAGIQSWTTGHPPFVANANFVDLMDMLRAMRAAGIPNYSLAYFLSLGFYGYTGPTDPYVDLTVHGADQNPHPGPLSEIQVVTDHGNFVALYQQAATDLAALDVNGLYLDAPFGERIRDYHRRDGVAPESQRAVRTEFSSMLQILCQQAPDGNGAVAITEQCREGLDAVMGVSGNEVFRVIPGAVGIEMIDALHHDYQLTGYAGDLFDSWQFLALADSAICPCGVPGAIQQVHRSLIHPTVMGRLVAYGYSQVFQWPHNLVVNPTPPLGAIGAELKRHNDVVLRRSMALRGDTPALVTGRMLPVPPVIGDPYDTVYYRINNAVTGAGPPVADDRLWTYRVPRYPIAFWAIPNDPDKLVVVAGNPTQAAAVVQVRITIADYPELAGGTWSAWLLARPGSSDLPVMIYESDTLLKVDIPVDTLDYGRVELRRE